MGGVVVGRDGAPVPARKMKNAYHGQTSPPKSPYSYVYFPQLILMEG